MQNTTFDIIKLIESTLLSSKFQTKLLTKIKESFSNDQQQLFISNFYCYLNHNSKTDFIIKLNDIWKWCGFSRIDPAKVVLVKNFKIDIDYKIEKAPATSGTAFDKENKDEKNKETRGNKEKVLMTINTFKKFCLKAGTKKADEIHDYYIKLEELLQEMMNEESAELRLQLETTQEQLQEKDKLIETLELNLRLRTPQSNDYEFYQDSEVKSKFWGYVKT